MGKLLTRIRPDAAVNSANDEFLTAMGGSRSRYTSQILAAILNQNANMLRGLHGIIVALRYPHERVDLGQ